MRVRAIKSFSSSYNGNVSPGQIFEVPTDTAIQMQGFGLVELIRTTEQTKRPLDGGTEKPSASSQAGQASQESKSNTSEESAESSQSTQATSSRHGVMQSTQQTGYGGKGTTTKRRKGRKSGARTSGAKSSTD